MGPGDGLGADGEGNRRGGRGRSKGAGPAGDFLNGSDQNLQGAPVVWEGEDAGAYGPLPKRGSEDVNVIGMDEVSRIKPVWTPRHPAKIFVGPEEGP